MNKNTLADIVIKSLRLANSVIASSYEFPDVDINTSAELEFRDNVLRYCKACHEQSRAEERADYTRKILEYAASLHDDERGEKLPGLIKAVRRCRHSTYAGIGLTCAGALGGLLVMNDIGAAIVYLFSFAAGAMNIAYDTFWERRLGMPLEKALAEQYWQYEQNKDTAEELRKAVQKEFNEAMFEHWDELMTAYEDTEHK